MLLTNSGRKGNIIVLEDLTLPHDPIQKRDQRTSRGKVTLPHESVVCIKRIKRCVLFPLIIDTHSPDGAIDMMIDERVDRVAPHSTVVWFACNENGDPGILLLVRSPT